MPFFDFAADRYGPLDFPLDVEEPPDFVPLPELEAPFFPATPDELKGASSPLEAPLVAFFDAPVLIARAFAFRELPAPAGVWPRTRGDVVAA